MPLEELEPMPQLLQRTRTELAATFARKPLRIARAPGRLDLMGGITDYTGGLVLEMPLEVAAGVVLTRRDDRQVQVVSLNWIDEHKPFQFQIPLDGLADVAALRRELAQPGRDWAGYVVGCLSLLHETNEVDLASLDRGFDIAIYSTVPGGGGVSSSAALEVACMNAFVDEIGVETLRDDGVALARLCQRVENEIVGAPCGLMDQIASHLGRAGKLLRMQCQPHDLLEPLPFPEGIRGVGINTNVKHSVGGGAYGRTRTAAFMGQTLMRSALQAQADAANKNLVGDPFRGYLANLESEDYKAMFRPDLPEAMSGRDFLARFDTHGDPATTVEPEIDYAVQAACDHHVLDHRRVQRFVDFFERIDEIGREKALRSAGHLMYASHKSYGDNAGLGCAEADEIVRLVKEHEQAGLYGARITGGGAGGTVGILCDDTDAASEALNAICTAYAQATDHEPQLLQGSSDGAAETKAKLVSV